MDLDGQEWANENEISNVTSVMKLWLRELPDPLLTYPLHQGFIEGASTFTTFLNIYVYANVFANCRNWEWKTTTNTPARTRERPTRSKLLDIEIFPGTPTPVRLVSLFLYFPTKQRVNC